MSVVRSGKEKEVDYVGYGVRKEGRSSFKEVESKMLVFLFDVDLDLER